MTGLDHSLILEKNEKVSPDTHVLTFACHNIPRARAGQFFELTTPYFLRRPFAVMDQSQEEISFGIKLAGKGSAALADLKRTDEIFALGPLGNGFNLDNIDKKGKIMVLGGGSGVFPLFNLVNSLKEIGLSDRICQIYGFRSPEYSFFLDKIRENSVCSIIASDNGGLDFHGNALEAVNDYLQNCKDTPGIIFCCGPEALMKGAALIGKSLGAEVQVSLETRMGCGMGLCRGCSVDLTDPDEESGFKRVRCCVEGPVFPADRVIWPEGV